MCAVGDLVTEMQQKKLPLSIIVTESSSIRCMTFKYLLALVRTALKNF